MRLSSHFVVEVIFIEQQGMSELRIRPSELLRRDIRVLCGLLLLGERQRSCYCRAITNIGNPRLYSIVMLLQLPLDT